MFLILPVLADIGHGIIATLILGVTFDITLTWHFIVGILIALLPDIDAVPRLLRTGSVVATNENPIDHREYAHYPVPYALVGLMILVFSTFWGFLFLLATMLHFINDSWGTGFGVKWLWPFSYKQYKWRYFDANTFSRNSNQKPTTSDDDKNKWIRNVYLTPTPISLVEYGIFIIGLISLLIYFS